MEGTPHDRFRERLAVVGDTPALVGMLTSAGVLSGAPAAWRRTSGRFTPPIAVSDRSWVSLCLETSHPQQILSLDVYEDPAAGRVDLGPVGFGNALWFPVDPALPTLAAAVRRHGPVDVVRYRPGRRCTVRAAAGDWFGKVVADAATARMLDEDRRRLHAAATAAGSAVGFRVAAPIGLDGATLMVREERLPGVPVVTELFGPEGIVMARRLGAASASVARLPVTPSQTLDREVQLTRSAANAKRIGLLVPHLADEASRLIDRIARVHAAAPATPSVPIHGGLHPHQWLDDGGRLGLIDFDRLSWGDRELDAATFVGEVDFERSTAAGPEALNAAFLEGYETGGGPLDPGLLAAYRAEKRLAKALRTARALRTDGDTAAARHLVRAAAALDGIG